VEIDSRDLFTRFAFGIVRSNYGTVIAFDYSIFPISFADVVWHLIAFTLIVFALPLVGLRVTFVDVLVLLGCVLSLDVLAVFLVAHCRVSFHSMLA